MMCMILRVKSQLTHQQQTGQREAFTNYTVTAPHCHYNFSYKRKVTGTFSSPEFPNNYPDEVTCTYFFQAPPTGRVRISFDYFDLEKPSDKGCKFDYLEIFDIDNDGFKTLIDRHCGSRKPNEFVSLQSKLEIVFTSDFTKNSNGFLAHYYFLGDNWQPFGPSTIGCGPGYITGSGGVLTSPDYPNNFPAMSRCTWIIKVKDNQKILLTLTDLDINSSNNGKCSESFLTVYNGFAIPGMYPEETYCGNLHELTPRRQEFLSTTPRIVIRHDIIYIKHIDLRSLQLEGKLSEAGRGFQLAWTAVDLINADYCYGFLCPGSNECEDKGGKCPALQVKFCIDSSLRCNDLPNCGAEDNADEKGCILTIVWIIVYTVIPLLVIVILVTTIVLCYRRHKRKRLRMIKTEAQMAQQTHWVSPHIRSLDSSPTQNRTTIHTTSFVSDKHSSDPDLSDSKRVTIVDNNKSELKNYSRGSPNCNDISNSRKSNQTVNQKVTPIEDDRKEVTHVHLEPINNIPPNFKSHQKRSSYHLMQELNLEDSSIS
ncbi:hypothetical protein FSP39_012126 [Pinctada imbricata]|uniref:CUB domain-containing protein n=1 Tax=Pinctada imbricata TaxID=66713 RepID=A0AA88XRP4_PINIB|nr:hypothetical protein FSP39_012126 [Pinctada imbricata]